MTSNEFYGKINRRFDKREKELREMGYKRETLSAYNVALYVRVRHGKTHAIPAGTVMNASKRVWDDMITECQRFCHAY